MICDRKIVARVNRDTKSKLQMVCARYDITESEFIRMSVTSYLRTGYGVIVQEGEVSDGIEF